MKLLRYKNRDDINGHGLLIKDAIFPLRGMTTTTALDSLKEGGEQWNEMLRQTPISLAEVELLPPVENPGAFLDFSVFEEHVKTARKKRNQEIAQEWYEFPVWYNGSPRCFSGDRSTVVFPDNENKKDFELELAIVIKKKCFKVNVDQAAGFIGGYTIVNDFSARELQARVMKVGLGPAKAKDFNYGVGPCIVTPEEIPDPRDLTMRAWVNGELWCEGNSGSAHYTFEQMIAFASEYQTLYPGDVLASGTVGGGCGLELDRFLNTGDKVELEIEPIGRLTHWVG